MIHCEEARKLHESAVWKQINISIKFNHDPGFRDDQNKIETQKA